jgi:cytochrome c-type biogenesis protein
MIGRLPIAFAAGFVSFLAPCVLPLVPGYLSAVSSVDPARLGERGTARRVAVASLPFIAGFTLLFVLLGAGAGAAGGALTRNQRVLQEIAGFIVIVLGLALLGVLPVPERLVAPGLVGGAHRRSSGMLLGAAFAVCAAPCVGPVLASILLLAGDSSTALQGSLLLFAYSLGLAVPFLLAGIAFTRAMAAFRWLRDHYTVIRVASGATLVALGLLLFFDRYWWLRVGFNRVLNVFGLGV